MKRVLLSFLLQSILFQGVYAQGYTGTWVGALTSMINANDVAPIVVTIRANEVQFNGVYWIEFKGAKDKYTMQGTIENNTATGTATYPIDGSVFQIEAILQNGQLVFAIGLAGIPILAGTLSRQVNTSSGVTRSNQANGAGSLGRTSRASGLAGQWEQKVQGRRLFRYRSGGGLIHKWYFDLCSNGSYNYIEESYMSGLSSNESEIGTWEIVIRSNVIRILFSPQNKTPYEWTIASVTQAGVVMDGLKYSFDRNQSCQ